MIPLPTPHFTVRGDAALERIADDLRDHINAQEAQRQARKAVSAPRQTERKAA